jgi:hypothetical protein
MVCLTRLKGSVSAAPWAELAVLGVANPRPPQPAKLRLTIGLAVLMVAIYGQAAPAGAETLQQDFPHIFATRGCTQEDAPALEIFLTPSVFAGPGEPAPPYIRIEIGSPANETIRSSSLTLSPLRRDPAQAGRLARAELVRQGQDPVWLSGSLTLTEAVPGRQVAGRFDFATPTGLTLNRDFKTDYSARKVVCG